MVIEDGAAPTGEGSAAASRRLPFLQVAKIDRLPEGERWLVEGFLSSASIGVLASTPKAGKTWLTLALATAVASGTPAMGHFHVPAAGPVLLYPAEDDPRSIRERVESLCRAAGLELATLPIHIITADSLRLDEPADRQALEELIDELRPRLLVLDPLVRLHSGAESYAGHVAELFGYLRQLQRRFQLAVLVTHHVAKNRAGSAQPGQAMRGSGDIHAAYDHGATLERRPDGSVLLTLEHRTAPTPDPLAFRLHSRADGATFFEIVDMALDEPPIPAASPRPATLRPLPRVAAAQPLDVQVLDLLRSEAAPLSQVGMRRALRVRNETLTAALRDLERRGLIVNLGRMGGWTLSQPDTTTHGEASADGSA